MAGKRLLVVILIALGATAMAFVVGGQGAVAQTGPEGLDASHWGNAQTIVPVYDTVWDLGVSARVEEVQEYTAWLANEGFSGFATTYLGSIHRPANRSDQNFFTRGDPYGNPIATWDASTGNLIMNAAHANRFEQFLDAAHAEGLRVQLFVIWERKAVDEYGLINDGNAYNWAHQIGSRFKDHPAIQSWVLGGDAETDNPRTTLWNNAANGLRDAGVTGEITYGTGSAPQRRINNLNASWNEGQFVQTSHCGTPDLIEQRIGRVVGQSNIPVWAGEMRYEAINADWCNPAVPIPGANEVRADALAAVRAGAAGIVYGHNDRWQWGHGALGGNSSGWNAVRASFSAPGHRAVLAALGGTPPAPTTTTTTTTTAPPPPDVTDPLVQTTSPAANATLSPNSAATISGTATDDESGVTLSRVRVRRASSAGVEFWNGSAWQGSIVWNNLTPDTSGNWSLGGVDLSSVSSYSVHTIGRDGAGNVSTAAENPVLNFRVSAVTDTSGPVVELAPSLNGRTIVPDSSFDITGNATDPSGINFVRVQVRRLTSGGVEYWNGTSWGSTVVNPRATVAGDGSWQLAGVDLSSGGSYTVRLISRDGAGNRSTGRDNGVVSFEVGGSDSVGPNVDITAPTEGEVLSVGGLAWTIEGTSTDPSGVDLVRVRVRRSAASGLAYWDGTSWVSSSVWLDVVPDTNGNWQLSGVQNPEVSSYRIQVIGFDSIGNVSTFSENPQRVVLIR